MEATTGIRRSWAGLVRPEPLAGAYFWLLVFIFVYWARPEDWIPGLVVLPMAKISGVFALLALLLSLGSSKRGLFTLPKEVYYLLALDAYLMASALLSPVWKGGAVFRTLDFFKAWVAVVVIIFAVTNWARLRRLILLQTGSVILVSAISIIKGHGQVRLQSVLKGMYGNPNELAFDIGLIVPFCLAFMLSDRSIVKKATWAGGTLISIAALLLTGSRGGFITLVVAGLFCLWSFAVKGRRPLMFVAAVSLALLLFVLAGSTLRRRFAAISGENITTDVQASAYGSYEQRQYLMEVGFRAIKQHPIFGIGAHNFPTYSGTWRTLHCTFLEIAAEGGIPAFVLFLSFFWCGFGNLRRAARAPNPDPEIRLFTTAVRGSLIAYLVGGLFAPDAYQFFPLFAVAYTSVLVVISEHERESLEAPETIVPKRPWRTLSVYTATSRSNRTYACRSPQSVGEWERLDLP